MRNDSLFGALGCQNAVLHLATAWHPRAMADDRVPAGPAKVPT